MKVLQINTVYACGSTGRIVEGIHDLCREEHIDCLCACRWLPLKDKFDEDIVAISSKWDSRIHGWLSRFTMYKGLGSIFKTALFLKKVEHYKPDVIHLHNLHGSYINLPMSFRFIKKRNIPVVWTLHDCWPMTAICSHFTIVCCEQWKNCCRRCPQRKKYATALFDVTKKVWNLKKKWFTGIDQAVLVTPSMWLEKLVASSFLKNYSIKTIHNGIDLSVFRPVESDFKERYSLQGKNVVLGVAFDWGYEKGLDVFARLANQLPENYAIVLVGVNEVAKKLLPNNVITIRKTDNQKELAEMYTSADVFVNPTREEVLGLVNLEALACGTPVITFQTGGSPECIDESCGCVVPVNDLVGMRQQILRICRTHPYDSVDCIAKAKQFEKHQKFTEYITLYKNLCQKPSKE